jgi:signal transduction histidine kinase
MKEEYMNAGQTFISIPYNRAWVEQAIARVYNYAWLFDWGMFFFLLATLGIAIWIFFDSTNKNKGDKALVPRILSMVGVFLIAPAFIFRYTGTADGVTKLVRLAAEAGAPYYEAPINLNVKWLVAGYGPTIALVALLGVIISVVAVVVYSSTVARTRPSTEFMGALNNKFAELEHGIAASRASASGSAPTFGPANAGGNATVIERKPAAATVIERPGGASLRATAGSDQGRVWNLPARDVQMGRDASNFIVLSDGKASREHAKLRYDAGAWTLSDKASANGTYYNDALVAGQQPLSDGDSIRIGDSTFLFSKAG